jgi:hypothetical protein
MLGNWNRRARREFDEIPSTAFNGPRGTAAFTGRSIEATSGLEHASDPPARLAQMQTACRSASDSRTTDERVIGSENIPAFGNQVAHCAREISRNALAQCLHDGLDATIGMVPSSAPHPVPSVRSRTDLA